MNQRDLELLDKELWGVSPNPPIGTRCIGFNCAFTIEAASPAVIVISNLLDPDT
jgi:hypothetical protein